MIPTSFPAALVALSLLPGLVSAHPQEKPGKKYEPAVKLPEGFVRFTRVPDGGVQPRVATSADAVAVLYFRGGDEGGDLYLARSKDEAKTFEPSVRVNAVEGAVRAQESGHAGSLALGPDGRAHVAWVEGAEHPALRYACERAGGGGLGDVVDLGAPERLCSTSAIAVGPEGRVHVFYAALDTEPRGPDEEHPEPEPADEGGGESSDDPAAKGSASHEAAAPGLRIHLRTSSDGGATFAAPIAIDRRADGVLATAAISAHADPADGRLYLFYLSAGRRGAPEFQLMVSEDGGASFNTRIVERGTKQKTVLRSRPTISQEVVGKRTIGEPPAILAWDSYAHVYWSRLEPKTFKPAGFPVEPRLTEKVRRFRPDGLANGSEYLLAWLEQPVGDRTAPAILKWQVWYQAGLAPLGWGAAPEPAGPSAPAVVANRAGGFTILY